jgi:hypothetical protein
MKTILRSLLALEIILACAGCCSSNPRNWDYKVTIAPSDQFGPGRRPACESTINDMVHQGWSLVSVSAGSNEKIILVFKKHR